MNYRLALGEEEKVDPAFTTGPGEVGVSTLLEPEPGRPEAGSVPCPMASRSQGQKRQLSCS